MENKQNNPLTLIQPNRVTNARYSFNAIEENILTLMIDAIQKHMNKEKLIQTDLFNQPMISIDVKDMPTINKTKVRHALTSLRKKEISFDWTNSEGVDIETETSLIGAIHNHKETSIIDVTIQTWAIPYLTYIGKGVGGTIYNKTIALTLKGQHTKRFYKLCKRWEDVGGFAMSLLEFRETFGLETKYPKLKDLRKNVFDNSIEILKEDADVYFNYAFKKIGGSRSYNHIDFTVHGNNQHKPKEKKTDMYVFVYNILCLAYPNYTNSAAQEICDKVALNPENFEKLYRKMKRVKSNLDNHVKDIKQTIGLIKHIINEDFK